jgi:thimet oligopeptidase
MNRIHYTLSLSLIFILSLNGCEGTKTSSETESELAAESTPVSGLVAEYRNPKLADMNTGNALSSECDSAVRYANEWLARLEDFSGAPTVEYYLEALNGALVSNRNMDADAQSLAAFHPDAGVREAGEKCGQAMSKVNSDFGLSRPIYEHVKTVDLSSADNDTQRFVEKLLLEFSLAGVDRDDATRARIRELNEEITAVGQEFDKNIRDSVLYLELNSTDQLAGLPQDYIDSHQPDENGVIRLSTQYPDYFPVMSYATNDDVRREYSVIRSNRAYPENQAVLKKLLELRYEFAQLLGFENYAAWVTADKMVGSPQRVEEFLVELSGYTEESQEREYSILLDRLKQDRPSIEKVESWQRSFLQEKITTEKFSVDSKEVREYFNYTNTRDGILVMVQDLFNVEIRPWDTPTWHEDVEAYEMWDQDTLLGQFYLDMHPRENKYQHAAHFGMRAGISGVQTPLAALICNFPRGEDLMQHNQVETFLHEFGHLIHGIFAGGHHWVNIAGVGTERDFVEAPSQMLEEWVWDYDSISQFARNSAGEPIPRDLLDKMKQARDFGLGMGTRRQMSLAAMSLGLYNRDPAELDLKAFTDEITRQYTSFEPLPEGNFYAAFGHLNGYSAIYYTYQWSLAIASDLFTRFEAEGLRNVETAGEYRDKVLARGGAEPAAQLVTDFLGREISFKPYADRLARAGLPSSETQ